MFAWCDPSMSHNPIAASAGASFCHSAGLHDNLKQDDITTFDSCIVTVVVIHA